MNWSSQRLNCEQTRKLPLKPGSNTNCQRTINSAVTSITALRPLRLISSGFRWKKRSSSTARFIVINWTLIINIHHYKQWDYKYTNFKIPNCASITASCGAAEIDLVNPGAYRTYIAGTKRFSKTGH